jgi:uncharacterized protein with HEPN domain
MLDAARRGLRHVAGRTRAQLDTDELLVDALVRVIEVVGEAARHVTAETRATIPEIPWPQVVGMRDRLAHGYFDVSVERVWNTVTNEFQPQIAALEKAVARLAP